MTKDELELKCSLQAEELTKRQRVKEIARRVQVMALAYEELPELESLAIELRSLAYQIRQVKRAAAVLDAEIEAKVEAEKLAKATAAALAAVAEGDEE